MTAIASQLPPIDLAGYLPAAEAAARLDRNADALTRACRSNLAPLGLALQAASPLTGQPQWFIKRSFDARLVAPEQQSAVKALEAASGKRRDQAAMKWRCVLELRKLRGGREPMMSALPHLIESLRDKFPKLKISRSTLMDWDKRAGDGNIVALLDTRGGHRPEAEASAEAWAAFEDFYLHQNQPTVRQCWKLVKKMAEESCWRWISYSQCRRQLDRKISLERQAFHRTPKIYRTQFAPSIHQNEESWAAGVLWIADHKQMDFWVCYRGTIVRPWLTLWMDWRTRRVVGWVLSDSPNSSTILGSLRMALKDDANNGGPAEVRIDNGKDFASYVFKGSTKQERRQHIAPQIEEDGTRGIFTLLSIAVHFALPHGPNGKSRCERFFGNLASFARTFDTFCGISSETRPERLKEILSNPSKIPSFAEAETGLAAFIAEYNENADHAMDDLSESGVRLSPNEAFSKWCGTRRVLADPAALDLLLAFWHKPVTVGRNGISLTIQGRTLRYGHCSEALRPFKSPGKKIKPLVHVSYDPAALESVRVWDSEMRFIATVPMNHVGGQVEGMTRPDVATVHRSMAAYRKSLRHQAAHSLTSVLTTEEQTAAVAFERQQNDRRAAAEAATPGNCGLFKPLLTANRKRFDAKKIAKHLGPAGRRPSLSIPSIFSRKIRVSIRLPPRHRAV
jgi:putative transposase